MDSVAWLALTLGFLLGLRHATDADHVVAVATVVSEYKNAWRGLWVGASWGLGHSTPLLILGTAIILLKGTIQQRYEQVAPVFEFGVGVMLVFLGLQVFWNLRRPLHLHEHLAESKPHVHIHTHGPSAEHEEEPFHGFFRLGRPFFRLKSYLIGIVHSLAGSAAVMLVVLSTDAVNSFWLGIAYILLFGVGTILAMGLLTLLLGVPFAITGRFQRLNSVVAAIAGVASVLFGAWLILEVAPEVARAVGSA
ncbi:MAG: urease accessory protein UreH [Chloroflexi bacterium]|nr:urease accessory protein UreH [Chloroflexota bacterium]